MVYNTCVAIDGGMQNLVTGQIYEKDNPDPPTEDTLLVGTSNYVEPGETAAQALLRRDTMYGRGSVVRIFSSGSPSVPVIASDRALIYSFKTAPNNTGAASFFQAVQQRINTSGKKFFWCWFHEPEDNNVNKADYIATWRRLRGIQVTNAPDAISCMIYMGFTLDASSGRNWLDWYAGDDYIDVIGWDRYNPLSDGYASASNRYDVCISTAASRGKKCVIGEWGSSVKASDPTGSGRASMIASHGAYFRSHPEIVAQCYYDSPLGTGGGNDKRLLDTPSINAMRDIITAST